MDDVVRHTKHHLTITFRFYEGQKEVKETRQIRHKRGGKLHKGNKESFCQFRQDKFPRNASEWKDCDFLIVKLSLENALNRTEWGRNVENLGFKSNSYEPFFVNVLSGAIMKPLTDLHEQTLPFTNHPTFGGKLPWNINLPMGFQIFGFWRSFLFI